jgi:hypothetical protein
VRFFLGRRRSSVVGLPEEASLVVCRWSFAITLLARALGWSSVLDRHFP